MTQVRDLVELVRLPAALTVPGDTFAGAAAAGWPLGRRTFALPVASAFLYWAGMALNDYADRELDAVERPERPVPSGRVTPRQALGVATGLTAAGLGVAAVAGGRDVLAVAAPLAASVWAYDLWLKTTPAGPLAMAAARSLDVAMGAGRARISACVPAAATVGLHTLALTTLSRDEVNGPKSAAAPAVALAGTAASATAALLGGSAAAGATRRTGTARVASAALTAAYAGLVGRAQLAAVREPTAERVRAATGTGILGMAPLQAALAARAGALPAAAAVVAVVPLGRALFRRVAAT
jgi:4-hydroxybenzoate polyprenyltransferase